MTAGTFTILLTSIPADPREDGALPARRERPSEAAARRQEGRDRVRLVTSWLLLVAVALATGLAARAQEDGRTVRLATVGELPASQKRFAIVIGVDDYEDPQITPLAGAGNDASALAAALVDFAGFPKDQVFLLASSSKERPTRGNILRRLSNLRGVVPKDGLLLVAFSGHGIDRAGRGYLIPSDAQALGDVDLLEETAVSVESVRDRILATGVGQVIFIVDACRNDPVAGKGDSDNPMSAAFSRGFSFDVANREVKAFATLYATEVGHRAYEDHKRGRGYFSQALVEGISGKAANARGEVTLGALVTYLETTVPRQIALDFGAGKRQLPSARIEWYRAAELIVAIARPSPPLAGAIPAVVVDPAVPTINDLKALELEFWRATSDTDDPRLFHEYLVRFPGGAFESIAESKLRRLVDASRTGGHGLAEHDPVFFLLDPLETATLQLTTDKITRIDLPAVATGFLCGDVYDSASGSGGLIADRSGLSVFVKPLKGFSASNFFILTDSGSFHFEYESAKDSNSPGFVEVLVDPRPSPGLRRGVRNARTVSDYTVKVAQNYVTLVIPPHHPVETSCADAYDPITKSGDLVVERRGALLFLKPLKPRLRTSLTVRSDENSYTFVIETTNAQSADRVVLVGPGAVSVSTIETPGSLRNDVASLGGPQRTGGAALPATARPTGDTVVDLGGGVRIEMVVVPAGTFEMGSVAARSGEDWTEVEVPQHRVTISKPYLLGKYEVTQGQWKAVMGSNPSKFTGNDELPVEQVSWDDCQEFIRRLNAKTGMTFRLPTEAEREYACRAGTTGDYAGSLDDMAWYDSNSGRTTHPVGQKRPNGWGLYDMHGNVWEWCEDWYDENYYASSPGTDPTGGTGGLYRVYRGGSWFNNAANCRSATRIGYEPGYRALNLGLRLARST